MASPADEQAGASRNVLVTGGAGYIGSHTVVELLQAGYHVTVMDSLCNSSRESLARVLEITGKGEESLTFRQVRSAVPAACARAQSPLTRHIARAGRPPGQGWRGEGVRGGGAVLRRDPLCRPQGTSLPLPVTARRSPRRRAHTAVQAVGESVAQPLKYYENNMVGTFNLLRAMLAHGCGTIVFSSSATVYGDAAVPITESSTVGQGISNPYGWTKSMMEQVLRDVQRANPELRVVLLRYFNPVGAHARHVRSGSLPLTGPL